MAYDPADWDTADETAKDIAQHFYTDSSGAHVVDETGAELLLTSSGIDINDEDSNTTAFFHSGGAQVGAGNDSHIEISQNNIGMWVNYFTQTPPYEFVMKHAFSIWYNWQNDYIQIVSPDNKLWLQSQTGNITVSAADGDASAAVRLRGGRMQVVDENGNNLWSGTAQQLADVLSGPHIYTGTFTANVGTNQTSYMAWTASTFRSTFNVASGHESDCFVSFGNADVSLGSKGTITAEWWPSSYNPYGWRVRWQNQQSGNQKFSYMVLVPDSYSTV